LIVKINTIFVGFIVSRFSFLYYWVDSPQHRIKGNAKGEKKNVFSSPSDAKGNGNEVMRKVGDFLV
jgi:hypothetical protein